MFLPAWAVDGTTVPAAMARHETYRSAGGRGGITRATDLEVTELDTPGDAVRIMPGAATLLNSYPGGEGQAYGVTNNAAVELPVPATGSGGGATRYVIVRVDDPEFGGQEPAVPPYPTLVSSVDSLNFPHEVLARIDQPASTATITKEMIVDQRRLNNPRTWYDQRAYSLVTGDGEQLNGTGSDGEWYPNAAAQDVYIPEWATSVSIIAIWASVVYREGNTYGRFWLEFGPYESTHNRKYATQRQSFDADSGRNNVRTNWHLADTRAVASDIRGTTQKFVPKGTIHGGTGKSRPYMDAVSNFSMQLYFRELPASEYEP